MKEQREVFPRVGTFGEAMAFFADFRLGRYLKQSKASASCTGIFNYRLSKPSLGSEGTVYRDTQHRSGLCTSMISSAAVVLQVIGNTVTAEAAGSSSVVPAISNQALREMTSFRPGH